MPPHYVHDDNSKRKDGQSERVKEREGEREEEKEIGRKKDL